MDWQVYMVQTSHPILWVGLTQRLMRSMPRPVRRDIGCALYAAQQGMTDPAATRLKTRSAAQFMQIVTRHRADTYRVTYAASAGRPVHVTHLYKNDEDLEKAHVRRRPSRSI